MVSGFFEPPTKWAPVFNGKVKLWVSRETKAHLGPLERTGSHWVNSLSRNPSKLVPLFRSGVSLMINACSWMPSPFTFLKGLSQGPWTDPELVRFVSVDLLLLTLCLLVLLKASMPGGHV